MERDQLVVVTDDPLGHRDNWFGNSGATTVDGRLESLGEYSHDGAHKILYGARVGAVTFGAAGNAPAADVRPRLMSCNAALRFEEAYCEARWGGMEGGRWSCVQRAIDRLGLTEVFHMADSLLKQAGWSVNHEWSFHGRGREHWLDVVYVRRDTPHLYSSPSMRIHYELSSARGTLAMIAVGKEAIGAFDGPVEDHLHFIRTREDVAQMAADIGLPIPRRVSS